MTVKILYRIYLYQRSCVSYRSNRTASKFSAISRQSVYEISRIELTACILARFASSIWESPTGLVAITLLSRKKVSSRAISFMRSCNLLHHSVSQYSFVEYFVMKYVREIFITKNTWNYENLIPSRFVLNEAPEDFV